MIELPRHPKYNTVSKRGSTNYGRTRLFETLSRYELWEEMDEYTGGDGYLDKLCIELIGRGSSRCRPPTRDIRQVYREETREMMIRCGVPGVVAG